MLRQIGRLKIHYDLVGPESGSIVCMTHSLTSDSGMWAEQVPPLLAAGFQVLRLDMRGHGGSSSIPGPYTIEALAQDVLAVLDELGFRAVHLIGLSMGGMIGQVLAADYPDRLASLMACATAAKWNGDDSLLEGRVQAVKAAGSLDVIVDDNMQNRYAPSFKEKHPFRWLALRQTFLNTSLEGYFGCMAAIGHHDVTRRLARVRAPTLVISGGDDVSTPLENGKEIAALVPGGRYIELQGARHFLNVEYSDQFNRIMLDWLSCVRAMTPG